MHINLLLTKITGQSRKSLNDDAKKVEFAEKELNTKLEFVETKVFSTKQHSNI